MFRYFLFLFLFYVHKSLIQFFVHSIIYIWQETHPFHMISNTHLCSTELFSVVWHDAQQGKSPQCSCRELKFSSYHPHHLFLQLLLLVVVVHTCNSGAWTKEAGKSRSLWWLVLIVILIHSTITWEENLNERLCRPAWSVGVSAADCLDYVS